MSIPTVTGIDPASGPAGTQVVISGTGFTEDTQAVLFGAVSAGTQFAVVSPTQLVAYVPDCAGTVHVQVTTPEGTSAEVAGDQFTVDAYVGPPGGGGGVAPTVTGVVPNTAVDNDGGDTITVSGTGFTTAIAVRFGVAAESSQGSFTVVSDTELSVLTPPGSDTVDIIVTNSYGQSTATAADQYTYPDAPAPTVSAIAPVGGYYGDKVTITGTGFDLATSVDFGEEPAPFTATDDTTIVVYVPEGSGAVHVTVTGPGGTSTATAADLFTYGSGALPLTTATNVHPSGYTGWAQGDVTVTLTASANGGYGVAATYYTVDGGGITQYTGPFVVSGAGSHLVRWWSVDVRGGVEPVRSGYVNILSASAVPTGLALTPGIGFISAKWDNLVTARPTTYKVYIGAANPPTTLYAASSANVISIKRANADGLTYVAVSSVDVAGNESAKCAAQSATAIAAAADLANDSITSAMLAPSLTAPPLLAAEPSASGYAEGDYYYNTTTLTLRVKSGGVWVDAAPQGVAIVGQVIAGSIRVGAVGATELAANSVFANHLTVANFTNLIPNPTSEQDLTGMPAGGFEGVEVYTPVSPDTAYEGTKCRRTAGAGTGAYKLSTLTPLIPVVAGEQYFMSAMCKLSAASATGSARLWVQCLDASSVVSQPASVAVTATAWTPSTASFTVPAGAVRMRLTLAANFLEADRYAYADNLMLRKMVDGNLIVDGAVTADKIDGKTITGDFFAVGIELTSPLIKGGRIESGAAYMENGVISGATITGGTIRTAASAQRIEIGPSYSWGGSSYPMMRLVDASEILRGYLYYDASSGTTVFGDDVRGLQVRLGESGIYLAGAAVLTQGALKPATNWASVGSNDGIWIQDRYASALGKRWKIVFNSSTKGLSVSDGTNTYSVTLS